MEAGSNALVAQTETALSASRSRVVRPTRNTVLPQLVGNTRFWRLVVLAAVLAAWQLASGRLVDALFISSPVQIAQRILDLFRTGAIWSHLAATYSQVAVGYVLAAVVGIASGVLLGRSRFLADVLEPFILALYSIPKIALAPIFILWLGIGTGSKVGVAFLSAVFLVFTCTFAGIRSIDEELVTLARIMGSSRWDVLRRVAVPAATPFIFDGLITGLPFALIGAVVGEFMP